MGTENTERSAELALLEGLAQLEDLAEKKTKIYSRILMEASLAQSMEALSLRHEKRKEKLLGLAFGKGVKKKNGQGMDGTNGEDKE